MNPKLTDREQVALKQLGKCLFCSGGEFSLEVQQAGTHWTPEGSFPLWAVACPACKGQGPAKVPVIVAIQSYQTNLDRHLQNLPQSSEFQAHRYNTDDESVLHLWLPDGRSFDLRAAALRVEGEKGDGNATSK